MVAILVSGCAGPAWFTGGELVMPGQRRAADLKEESQVAHPDATPTLSQVLDHVERIKQESPSDFKVIQSAVEDSSSFPPQYRQVFEDQMRGLASSQQEQSRPSFPEPVERTAVQDNQIPVFREPAVQVPTQMPVVALTPPQIPMASSVAPASYSTDVAPAPLQSTRAVTQAAAVTAHVDDMPTQLPAPTPTATTTTQQVPAATALAEIVAAKKTPVAEEVLEPGQWNREIERALASLNADLARPNLERDEKARLEIMRRLLYVVTNRRDEAVSPIDQLDEDEQEYWKHQLHGLLVSTDADGKHPTTRRAALALRHLRTATDHLANVSTLDVGHLTFCKEVLSYGDYRVFDSYSFRAKDQVVMYVEIDNFAAHPRGDSFETELHSSYEIVDDAGRRVSNVVLPVDKQVSNNRRRDYFIAYLITMPSQIAAGSYRLQLTVEDVIGKKSNHAAIDFRIQ